MKPQRIIRRHSRVLTRLTGGLMAIALMGFMTPTSATATTPAHVPAVHPARVQMSAGEHLKLLADYGKTLLSRLGPDATAHLSSGGQMLINLGRQAGQIQQMAAQAKQAQSRLNLRPQAPRATRPGFANDVYAAEDFFSRLVGMTQSETTASWCGSNALIGFNDSGSAVATAFLALSPSGSTSFNGWSQSTDAGRSYADRGALLADPLPADLMLRDLLGDPVIGCTSRRNFYYSSIARDVGVGFAFVNSTVSVSRSVDGGTTFGGAVAAVSKDSPVHFLDKPWMAVEPGPTDSPADDVVHVTYTDFDSSGADPCPNQFRSTIEYVRSTDGGQTWSAPLALESRCGNAGALQGSQVEAGPGDTVYVGWERYARDFSADREIAIRRSTDLGTSFGPATRVAPVRPIGDSVGGQAELLQGNFRATIDLQGLAVDQSAGPRRGTVYLTFHDGATRQQPDPAGGCGGSPQYCFGDVFVTRSSNGGATWSAPVRINNDDIRLGIDQWFPAVDVDRAGTVWTTFYDRRNDDRNFLIDSFVARSFDGGATWHNIRATKASFAPITGSQDLFVSPNYMGDYNAIAADTTGTFPGVITAWGDNGLGDPNVAQLKFEG
jgi:hypothetical protein